MSLLAAVGIESVKLPPRAPNLNAYAERFVRTIKESCLDQMIFLAKSRYVGQFMSSLCTITRNEIIKDSKTG